MTRARLGWVLLPDDQTTEGDVARLAPSGVQSSFARVAMDPDVNVDNLRGTRAHLAAAAAELHATDTPNVICFACTSASIVIGPEVVASELQSGAPACRVISVADAVVAALASLDVRRLAIGTPYVPEIDRIEAGFLAAFGVQVVALRGLGLHTDPEIRAVTLDEIIALAESVDRPDADAVFLSCTGLRAAEVIVELEDRLGKPVITSNQAALWHALRLAGCDDTIPGAGVLLQS